jgi:hypothetical protein
MLTYADASRREAARERAAREAAEKELRELAATPAPQVTKLLLNLYTAA